MVTKEGLEQTHLVPDVLPLRSGADVKLDISLKKGLEGPQNIDAAVWNGTIELLFDNAEARHGEELRAAVMVFAI